MAQIIKNKLPKFPTLEEVKEGIEKISVIDLSSIKTENDIEAIHKTLDKIFIENLKFMSYQFMQMASEKFFAKAYRVRKYDKFINPDIISEYSYLPPNLTKEFSRANLPSNPVFYCSPDMKTAIFETIRGELKPNENNLYFISEWSFRPNYILNITPFIIENISDENIFKPISDSYKENLRKSLKELNESQIDIVFEVLKFMSSLFIKDNYIVTSYIAHKFLYADHYLRSDIFIYPSLQTDLHSVNFAISPNTVLDKMKLEKVFNIRIQTLKKLDDPKKFQIHFTFEQFAQNENGFLNWIEPNQEIDEYFKELFGESKNI